VLHPDELLRRLTSAQIAEWAAFFRIEPDADARSDSLAAQQLAMLGNINRSEQKTEPFEPHDFMPWIEKPKAVQVIEPLDAQAQATRLKALISKKSKD
jgi:hypothetical protein